MTVAIGITCDFERRPGNPQRERMQLNAAYLDAIDRAGGLPLPLPVLADYDDARLDALLDRVAGILFTGGDDLDPAHWGAALHPKAKPLHPRRDRFELDLFRRADQRRIPILAICLGHQLAHVARGGEIIQHLDDDAPQRHAGTDADNVCHPVEIDAGSHLAGLVQATRIEVNSRHHQAVNAERPGRDLTIVARSPDGVIEASEDCRERFLVAVQWHPEDMPDDVFQQRLFRGFVFACTGATSG